MKVDANGNGVVAIRQFFLRRGAAVKNHFSAVGIDRRFALECAGKMKFSAQRIGIGAIEELNRREINREAVIEFEKYRRANLLSRCV